MPKIYHFSTDQIVELEAARKTNKDKNIENRIKAILLRANGINRSEVAKQTGFSASHVTKLTALYQNKGLSAIVENHYAGNHRNLSYEEEEELLNPFKEKAEAGQIVEVSEILRAYEAKLGRTFEKDHGRIYRVLERHRWRKIMPRSKHPRKANDEAIKASKKLTQR